MSKHLFIKYTTESGTKITLFDDDIAEVTWSDGNGVVRVEGKTSAGTGMNLLEMLTGASKARNEEIVEQKRSELEAEKAATVAASKRKTRTVVIEEDEDDGPVVDLGEVDD